MTSSITHPLAFWVGRIIYLTCCWLIFGHREVDPESGLVFSWPNPSCDSFVCGGTSSLRWIPSRRGAVQPCSVCRRDGNSSRDRMVADFWGY